MNTIRKFTRLLAVGALTAGLAPAAFAQSSTGRIDVTVEDATGGRLPGVSVAISGLVVQAQKSDALGQARFLNLPVGLYGVSANLSGFRPYTSGVVHVSASAATPVTVRLSVAGAPEVVTVTAASPVADARRQAATTNITIEELQHVPTARDPWVMLQTVPTVYVDRVNVGGSEAGEQSNYLGKGSVGTDNTWSLDGVPITDMGATGSTPTYFDFDMFQEVAVTTGGADGQNPTPGVQLSLVLKSGANTPHGSVRTYFENERLQGNNLPAAVAQATGSTSTACVDSGYTQHCGNRTDKYQDYGFDVGGPVLLDRIWAWGSLGKTEVTTLDLAGQPDTTSLKNYAVKADALVNANVRANVTLFDGTKVKSGLGAGPTRLADSAWNLEGPTRYLKGEGRFVLGQNLFASARYAHISSGYQLTPVGGVDKDFYLDDANIWHNGYYAFSTNEPQHYAGGDASYFSGRHELKAGFSWRKTPVESTSGATGHKVVTIWNGYPRLIAQAQRDDNLNTTGVYISGYLTDTISMNRLTVMAGLRVDRQTSSYSATHVDAVPNFPLLPAVDAPAVDNVYDFKTLSPRASLTYALDESSRTIARASYAMFASQLPGNAAAFVSPIQPNTYVVYNAVDKNGNGVADFSEIDFKSGVQASNDVDLAHPGSVTASNKVGKITAPKTQELMVGLDRDVMANVGVSATLTYRYMNNFLWNPRNGITAASYTQSGTLTGTFANVGTVSIPYYAATGALPGYTAQNRPDYHRRYLGLEINATKRMSNRWMARAGFAATSWNEYFDSPAAILDRTPTATASEQYTELQSAGPLVNGGPVAVSSAGTGQSGVYLLSPKFQFTANGMFQAMWGIDLGGSVNVRQGYAEPFVRSLVATGDQVLGDKSVLLTQGAGQFRLDTVSQVDARVEKVLKFGGATLALDFDVFNLFNAATVLGRQYDARSTAYNSVLEVMNPRIARLGVRFLF